MTTLILSRRRHWRSPSGLPLASFAAGIHVKDDLNAASDNVTLRAVSSVLSIHGAGNDRRIATALMIRLPSTIGGLRRNLTGFRVEDIGYAAFFGNRAMHAA